MAAVAYGIRSRRDFTGSRGNLPHIGGSWRSHAGSCRKQSRKKSYKMDAGKLSGQAVPRLPELYACVYGFHGFCVFLASEKRKTGI